MSRDAHFETLAAYGAAAVRLVPSGGEPADWVGDGGGLADAVERLGRGPLVAVLRDPDIHEVSLEDGELSVCVRRDGGGGRFIVRWGADAVVDERVVIPPLAPRPSGPLFRPEPDAEVTAAALDRIDLTLAAVEDLGGEVRWFARGHHGPGVGAMALRGVIPAFPPERLGANGFREANGLRWAYVVGAMAGGIASVEVVIAAAKAGLLGFYGAGGLPIEVVEAAIERLAREATGAWGANLLHNPAEPAVEERTVDVYLKHGVRRVEASAYMTLTHAVVRYRLAGIHEVDGRVVCPNQVFAKVSRPEVAERFMRPAPAPVLEDLVARGAITAEQAKLAASVPVATAVTGEADSGGHTDHRPLPVLLPELLALRDRIEREERYRARGLRVYLGAAGGLGTPKAVWGAFAMGADYVLTGSVNQATIEAGTSPAVKEMLGEAAFTDVASGPAPDMFEIGAKVQVLARGSMYAQRAQRLYEIYKQYGDLDAIPEKERERLEKQIFQRPLAEVWTETEAYWAQRDPAQVERARKDPRHKLALTFRWYLGFTSRWARVGDDARKRDYQIWCGPAMGGFNTWAKGGPLERVPARTIASVAEALMNGAAAEARHAQARLVGLA